MKNSDKSLARENEQLREMGIKPKHAGRKVKHVKSPSINERSDNSQTRRRDKEDGNSSSGYKHKRKKYKKYKHSKSPKTTKKGRRSDKRDESDESEEFKHGLGHKMGKTQLSQMLSLILNDYANSD